MIPHWCCHTPEMIILDGIFFLHCYIVGITDFPYPITEDMQVGRQIVL